MFRFPFRGSGITQRLSILLFGVMSWVPTLHASTIIFATGPRQVGGREINVTASFDFNFTAQTVTISLLNLEANPTDISQTLGSLRFNIANADPTLTYQNSTIGTFDIDNQGRPKTDNRANLVGGQQHRRQHHRLLRGLRVGWDRDSRADHRRSRRQSALHQ